VSAAARNDGTMRWISRMGVSVLRALAWTWRVRFVNEHVVRDLRGRQQPFIHVLWHGQLLPLLWTHRDRSVAVVVSEHRDGEIIARVAHALGFRTVRGSTSRGAARALLQASRELEAGFDVAITVDGPRGPAGVVTPGAPVIAQRTGAPMVPTAASANRAWRLRSWDRFLVPKPFARVIVVYGEPITIGGTNPRDASAEVDTVARGINTASDVAMASLGGGGRGS
jgi:lysophospholipid acyltransferase (LPLAT)-like uncharacterized protein